MTTSDKNKPQYRNLMLHILCWALLFIVPLFFHGSDESWTMVTNRYLRGLGATVSYLLVFYLNYLWIVPRFMLKKKDWKMFLLINVLVLLAGQLAVDLWHVIINNYMPELNNNGPRMPGKQFSRVPRYFYGSLVNVLFIALAVAVRMYQRWQHLEEARKEAEAARAEAELSNLRNQLNPHFLLNTLNNIYALIAFDQDKAQTVVGELSKLFFKLFLLFP